MGLRGVSANDGTFFGIAVPGGPVPEHERGAKHMRELTKLATRGVRAAVEFFVRRAHWRP
jgi:hypothetical protein